MITITMDDDMARAVLDAVELSMRLRLNQPEELCWKFLDVCDKDFYDKRDKVVPLLKQAFDIIFPYEDYVERGRIWKNDEWYRLYNVFQTMNHVFGIGNFPPLQLTYIPLPKVKRTEDGEQE